MVAALEDVKSNNIPDLKQYLVGGPLLGSRQRNIASDFAPWDRFEPIITPEIKPANNTGDPQRYVLLPHSDHVTVLAYQTGAPIATLIPFKSEEESRDWEDPVLIESICISNYVRKSTEKTAHDVLNMDEDSDDEVTEPRSLEEHIEEVVVLAGCRDGTIREFSLAQVGGFLNSGPVSCGSYHIRGSYLRPRRVIVVSKSDPIMNITSPRLRGIILDDGIMTYITMRTKNLESSDSSSKSSTTGNNMNIKVLRALIPFFDGSSEASIVKNEGSDVQRKWPLDSFRCRVGRDKVGGFMNTAPFHFLSVTRPSLTDCTVFVILAQADAVRIYFDRVLERKRYPPMKYQMLGENPITSLDVSPNNDDIACGHYFGEISIMNGVLSDLQKFHETHAKKEQRLGSKIGIDSQNDPRGKLITTKAHWHAHSVGSIFYDSSSSPLNPILYSGGEESVLVTWQVSQGQTKPMHFLPRIALGSILHVACVDRVDENPSGGILVYSDDNSLQLFEAHSKGRLWKVQGLACGMKNKSEAREEMTMLELDPVTKDSAEPQLVVNGLPEAPGLMHWYDSKTLQLTASLEVSPFNKVSKTEASDDPMPVPLITNHAFCNNGKELITIDETSTENVFIGAYDEKSGAAYGVVTTIRFWTWNEEARHENTSKDPYTLVAAMTFPHGPKNRVSALAASKDGSMACTVSSDEQAFRLWKKVDNEDIDGARRMPSWTCSYKVTIPSGFSTFPTTRKGVTFSDDASTLALACGNMVTLWDCAEARFLTSLRHLEGAAATIDSIEFLPPGMLQDVLLIKSNLGVSLQSPFKANLAFEGWSWGLPWGTGSTIMSSVSLVNQSYIATTVYNSKKNRSQLFLFDALTGAPIVSQNRKRNSIIGEFIQGRVTSLAAVDYKMTISKWDSDHVSAVPQFDFYSLTNDGYLFRFTDKAEPSMTNSKQYTDPSNGPTISIANSKKDNRKRILPEISAHLTEPLSKKTAVDLFGLASSSDTVEVKTPSTAELPSLSQNFVRSFLGRQLRHESNAVSD